MGLIEHMQKSQSLFRDTLYNQKHLEQAKMLSSDEIVKGGNLLPPW